MTLRMGMLQGRHIGLHKLVLVNGKPKCILPPTNWSLYLVYCGDCIIKSDGLYCFYAVPISKFLSK